MNPVLHEWNGITRVIHGEKAGEHVASFRRGARIGFYTGPAGRKEIAWTKAGRLPGVEGGKETRVSVIRLLGPLGRARVRKALENARDGVHFVPARTLNPLGKGAGSVRVLVAKGKPVGVLEGRELLLDEAKRLSVAGWSTGVHYYVDSPNLAKRIIDDAMRAREKRKRMKR